MNVIKINANIPFEHCESDFQLLFVAHTFCTILNFLRVFNRRLQIWKKSAFSSALPLNPFWFVFLSLLFLFSHVVYFDEFYFLSCHNWHMHTCLFYICFYCIARMKSEMTKILISIWSVPLSIPPTVKCGVCIRFHFHVTYLLKTNLQKNTRGLEPNYKKSDRHCNGWRIGILGNILKNSLKSYK